MNGADCSYFYFKPGGKWKYYGRGRFPRPQTDGYHNVNRDEIVRENGSMPGLVDGYEARDLVIVIAPDVGCEVHTAYPRMLLSEIDH